MMTKEELFKKIQEYLDVPPVIIWGSGATVPYGMPTMDCLKTHLSVKFPQMAESVNNLETELGKECYAESIDKIKKNIWEAIIAKNHRSLSRLIKSPSEFDGIKNLVLKFLDVHPRVLNIITTNYDLVLEHTLAYHKINYATGFGGHELAHFDISLFNQKKNCVNIVKVHGSLDVFDLGDGNIRQSFNEKFVKEYSPAIIAPGKNKYRAAYQEPYRGLIKLSDDMISRAKCFLAVGFGFNDEHLTPKIKDKIRNGTPIVLITKKVSETAETELRNASRYVLLEESATDKTRVRVRDNSEPYDESHEGGFWQLNEFMKYVL